MNLYHVNIATEWAQQLITQLTVAYPNHDGTEQLREVVKGFVARTELTQTGKLTVSLPPPMLTLFVRLD